MSVYCLVCTIQQHWPRPHCCVPLQESSRVRKPCYRKNTHTHPLVYKIRLFYCLSWKFTHAIFCSNPTQIFICSFLFHAIAIVTTGEKCISFLNMWFQPHFAARSKSLVEHCSLQVKAQAEWLLETHALRVNEAANKNPTTLKSSRETDALETILKTFSSASPQSRNKVWSTNYP